MFKKKIPTRTKALPLQRCAQAQPLGPLAPSPLPQATLLAEEAPEAPHAAGLCSQHGRKAFRKTLEIQGSSAAAGDNL